MVICRWLPRLSENVHSCERFPLVLKFIMDLGLYLYICMYTATWHGIEPFHKLVSIIVIVTPSVCDMFMCKYCKPLIRNKLPTRFVLNGLQLDPVLPEVAKLDSFE